MSAGLNLVAPGGQDLPVPDALKTGWVLREARVVYSKNPTRDLPALPITSSADLVQMAHHPTSELARLVESPEEHFIVLSLNALNEPTGWYLAGKGGGAFVMVDPAAVFRAVILQLAHTIVLVHNHPTANPLPSADDISLTKRLVKGARLLGLDILDHVILTEDPRNWFSFRDAGLVFTEDSAR